jgi:hypothetical protein
VVDVLMRVDDELDVLERVSERLDPALEFVEGGAGVRSGVHKGEGLVVDQVFLPRRALR